MEYRGLSEILSSLLGGGDVGSVCRTSWKYCLCSLFSVFTFKQFIFPLIYFLQSLFKFYLYMQVIIIHLYYLLQFISRVIYFNCNLFTCVLVIFIYKQFSYQVLLSRLIACKSIWVAKNQFTPLLVSLTGPTNDIQIINKQIKINKYQM